MVICIDVGNSDIVAGIFSNDKLENILRFPYLKGDSTDNYFALLKNNFEKNNIDFSAVKGCLLCCVAPGTAENLACAMEKLFCCTPVIFKNDKYCGLNIKTEDPNEVGTDIIAGCMAAKELCQMPCIVIDMGTATTLTAMDKDCNVLGVSILPGVFTSMWALKEKTGLSFDDDITVVPDAIGTNTQKSVDSGIILGNAYAIDGIIQKMEEEIGQGHCSAVATGGASQFIVPHCRRKIVLNNNLLLEGLYCYYKNSIIK